MHCSVENHVLMRLTLVFSGSCLIIINQAQFSFTVDQLPLSHLYMELIMYQLGMACCFLIYPVLKHVKESFIDQTVFEAQRIGQETHIPLKKVCTLAVLLSFGLIINALSLVYLANSSLTQVHYGMSLLLVAALSRLILKIVIFKHEIIALSFAIIGLFCIITAYYFAENNALMLVNEQQNLSLGLLFQLISSTFLGAFYVSLEQLFKQHYEHPLRLCGQVGLVGLFICLPVAAAFNFVPCSANHHYGCLPRNGKYYLEDTMVYFHQIFDKPILILPILSQLCFSGLFQFTAIHLTQVRSALSIAVYTILVIPVVWIVGLIVTVATNKSVQWESTDIVSIVLQIVGIVIFLFGLLIFECYLKIPIFYCTQSWKKMKQNSLLEAQENIYMRDEKLLGHQHVCILDIKSKKSDENCSCNQPDKRMKTKQKKYFIRPDGMCSSGGMESSSGSNDFITKSDSYGTLKNTQSCLQRSNCRSSLPSEQKLVNQIIAIQQSQESDIENLTSPSPRQGKQILANKRETWY